MSQFSNLSTDEKKELLDLLQAKKKKRDENQLAYYKPYPVQRKFHNSTSRERIFQAGNQIGKTYCSANEIAYHLTGLYPQWWIGRKFDAPTVGWASGVTAESTRDTMQRLLLGRTGSLGTGSIPAKLIESVSSGRVIFTIFIFINNKSKPSKEAAVRAFLVGDYIQAHNNWFNLAKERDDKAQMMLGMSEYMGLNGFKDLDEAINWYRLAADKGNQYAQYTLGKIFEESEEKKDYSQAFKWYEKAAKSGNGFAQYKLGTFFMDGKGVIQNKESAHIWLNLSSSTGNFRANRSRTNLETHLSEEQLALAQKGALRCFVSNYVECP